MITVDPKVLEELDVSQVFWAAVKASDGSLISRVSTIEKGGKAVELPITRNSCKARGVVSTDFECREVIAQSEDLRMLMVGDTVMLSWN